MAARMTMTMTWQSSKQFRVLVQNDISKTYCIPSLSNLMSTLLIGSKFRARHSKITSIRGTDRFIYKQSRCGSHCRHWHYIAHRPTVSIFGGSVERLKTHFITRKSSAIATNLYRLSHTNAKLPSLILGIETSCDDTGAAVVDSSGSIVGEALNSQTGIHVETGGIIPHVARDLHRQNIEEVVNTALKNAGVTAQDVDAIACTVKPGLLLSLDVGRSYAQKLVSETRNPFIPIHHMEAHALTIRMIERVEFPFLVLLISGGHCLLAVAQDVDDFLLLGTSLDDAPGDAYDKTARKLKLKNIRECAGLSGGAAIEKIALKGDPHAFPLTTVMSKFHNCDFSFAGIKEAVRHMIEAEELKYGL